MKVKTHTRTRPMVGAAVTAPNQRPQDLERKFDKTQLKSSHHGKLVHRDYAAHFFRWGFAAKFIKTAAKVKVLDIGCGQETPLIRVLTANMCSLPAAYVGVDLNRIHKKSNISWVAGILDEFDFTERWSEVKQVFGTFDVIVCFEVIEHMHPDSALLLLNGIKSCMTHDAQSTCLLSTPLNNGRKMAANHIHEYGGEELQELITSCGLTIERRFGTFGAWNEMKRVMTPGERSLMEELLEYYGHDVLSCFLAPKYPEASRNNTWVIRRC